MRFHVAALLLASLVAGLPAGAGETPPIERPPRFEHLTTDDGLSHGIVKAIAQDRRGFLWFGTWGGLDRFDGYEVVSYKHAPDDSTSLAGNTIQALLVDHDDTLWVATSAGLSRYDRELERFTSFRHDPDDPTSLGHDNVWTLFEDQDGVLWVLTLGGGLNRFDRESETFERFVHDPDDPTSLPSNNGRAICQGRGGTLWIGTPEAGLVAFDPKSGTAARRYVHDPDDPASLSGDDVWSVLEDSHGVLWVGTRTHGLNRLDRESGRFVRYPPRREDPSGLGGSFVFTMHEDRDGELWLAVYDGGIHRYDRADDCFVRYLPDPADPHSPSHFQVVALHEDRNGALWMGTFGAGVDRLDPGATRFGLYRHLPDDPRTLSGEDVRAVHEDADGVLWIGTYDGGLTRFDRRSGEVVRYVHDPDDKTSLADDRVQTLYEDRQGRLWVGTWGGGLNRFDRESGGFVRYVHDPEDPESLVTNDVRAIHEGDDGTLWIGTGNRGVDALDPRTGTFRHYPPDPERTDRLAEGNVMGLAAEDDVLWLGLWGGGLNRFDTRTGEVVRYQKDPDDPRSLSDNEVWDVHAEGGELWLATSSGLNRFDPEGGTTVHYRQADGLASDAVYDVDGDGHGSLWMTTGAGLSRFDLESEGFKNFDVSDGLQEGDFFDGCLYRSPSGELFVGGKMGLNFFDPRRVEDNPWVPPVVLTGFEVWNRPVPIGVPGSPLERSIVESDEVVLGADASVVTFSFAALSYRAPRRNRYAYRLEGLEDEWNQVDSRRRYATYTSLDPGRYVFRVRASNNDGVWNDDGVALAVRVLPPPWETWWFKSLAAALVAGLVWGAYLQRTARMRSHGRALEAEIRERRRAETEREHLIDELGAKNEELEKQNAELERFAYTVSHDLKAPLVTIKGFLGLLERDVEAGNLDGFRRGVGVISDAASSMHRLLGDLLELARVGRVVSPPERVSLTELVAAARATVSGAVRERGVEMTVTEPMPEVWGDRVRLREVFENLLTNAVKFMGDEPEPRIEVGARPEGEGVLCWVRDNGIGIAPRYQHKIFELFERLDPGVEGTGVGLALVKRIVEVHGGEVRVESEGEGRGSTFYFSLPSGPGSISA